MKNVLLRNFTKFTGKETCARVSFLLMFGLYLFDVELSRTFNGAFYFSFPHGFPNTVKP